jgi:selenide,water dikinase
LTPDLPVSRDIVLVGGGHAHVAVLKRFGMRPEPGVRLTLVSRDVVTPYSGMLPGLIAGHYSHDEAHIDLRPLARFARARLYHAAAIGIDLANRRLELEGRPPVAFDVLSIDSGSTPSKAGIAGAERALAVKPVDRFLGDLQALEAEIVGGNGPFRLVLIGGGAAGAELSLCLRYRLSRALKAAGGEPDRVAIAVVADTAEPLPSHASAVRRTMRRFLAEHGVELKLGHAAVAIEAGAVRLRDGEAVPCDAAVLATNAAPPTWLGTSGLALDDAGFIAVGETLQSLSHPFVFAAGDVAALRSRRLAKSGVFAVRQGPVLAENLRRAASGRPLRRYRPQRRTLALISSGERRALASYGQLALTGDWVWRAKDWIDRRWMRQYQELPRMQADANGSDAHAIDMRCGGCGAKVASPVLRRVLSRLAKGSHAEVVIGLEAADDAAVLAPPAGKLLVQTVDHFRAFIDDPYLFGRITVNHCLGDIYAMGAEPRTALALVSLPYAPEAKLEADLSALLQGAVEVLDEAGVQLIGGHTGEAAELAFGLSLNGEVAPERILRRGGMRPGDRLLLTKPLGTGCIFAAEMRGEARAEWVERALAEMQVSNREASRCLLAHGATAATDVTGFGLLGHLVEMLNASGMRAELDGNALLALPGAVELVGRGVVSSLHAGNETFAEALGGQRLADPGRHGLLFDPQTAGGLLASLPAGGAEACLAALRGLGYGQACGIGRVVADDGHPPLVKLLR